MCRAGLADRPQRQERSGGVHRGPAVLVPQLDGLAHDRVRAVLGDLRTSRPGSERHDSDFSLSLIHWGIKFVSTGVLAAFQKVTAWAAAARRVSRATRGHSADCGVTPPGLESCTAHSLRSPGQAT